MGMSEFQWITIGSRYFAVDSEGRVVARVSEVNLGTLSGKFYRATVLGGDKLGFYVDQTAAKEAVIKHLKNPPKVGRPAKGKKK